MVLLMLIDCFVVPIDCGGSVFCRCCAIQWLMSYHCDGKEEAGCFTLIAILVSCDC